MKNVLKLVVGGSIFALALVACKKEEITKNEESKAESSEAKALTTNVAPVAYGPDLVVTSVTTTLTNNPNSPCGSPMLTAVCGQQYTAQVTVTNVGNAPVTNYYYMRFGRISGTPALYDFLSPTQTLAPGASHTFNIPPAAYSTCSGKFSIEQLAAFADGYNDIPETNETNNRSAVTKYCAD